MLGVLQIALGEHRVAGDVGIAGEGDVLLRDVSRRAADLHVGPVRTRSCASADSDGLCVGYCYYARGLCGSVAPASWDPVLLASQLCWKCHNIAPEDSGRAATSPIHFPRQTSIRRLRGHARIRMAVPGVAQVRAPRQPRQAASNRVRISWFDIYECLLAILLGNSALIATDEYNETLIRLAASACSGRHSGQIAISRWAVRNEQLDQVAYAHSLHFA